MISYCVCVLAVASASAQNLAFDLEKLTDFSSDFEYTFDASTLPIPLQSEIHGKGSMQVDIKGKRFRIAARTDYDIDMGEAAMIAGKFKGKGDDDRRLQGGKGKGKGSVVGTEHASITFSAPGNFASMRFWENVNTKDMGMGAGAELAACALVNFPPGLLDTIDDGPNGEQGVEYLMRNLGLQLKQAEGAMNQMPHDEQVIDGKTVEVFQGPSGMFAGIEPDGSPFAVGLQGDLSNPLIKFTDFTAGAGDIEEMSCKQIPTVEFLAHPKAPKAFAILGQIMKAIRKNPTLDASLDKIPSEFSNFFLAAAGTETTCLAAPPPQTGLIGTVVVAVAGGVIGAAMILLAARQMAKRQVSLLS
jgi:hypothetical protein